MGQGNGIPSETYAAYRNCVAKTNAALETSLQKPSGGDFKIECKTHYKNWKPTLDPAAQAQIIGDLLLRDVQVNDHQLAGKTWTIHATDTRFHGTQRELDAHKQKYPLELKPNQDSWGHPWRISAWRSRMRNAPKANTPTVTSEMSVDSDTETKPPPVHSPTTYSHASMIHAPSAIQAYYARGPE